MKEIIAQTVAMKHQVMQEQQHAQGAGSDALEWCLERLWHHDGWRFFTKSAGNYTVWALGQGTRMVALYFMRFLSYNPAQQS